MSSGRRRNGKRVLLLVLVLHVLLLLRLRLPVWSGNGSISHICICCISGECQILNLNLFCPTDGSGRMIEGLIQHHDTRRNTLPATCVT